MKISLLVPSRERIKNKIDLVESIINTVSDINNVVLYFGIDDDDPTKEETKNLFREHSFIKIINIHNDGKYLGVGKLWNICAEQSKEDIFGMIGDDMVFKTEKWDEKILKEFDCEDNFKMVYCNDGRHGSKIAVNSFVHRKYAELNGYYAREEFMVDFIDLWMQQVFHSLNRLFYRGDILIEHKHWAFRKSIKDNVAVRMRDNDYSARGKALWVSMFSERVQEAKMISEKLGIPFIKERINNGWKGFARGEFNG